MRNKIICIGFFVAIVFFTISCDSWNAIWGDHSLGNNLSLLEGDRKEDRVIVYCSGRSAGACFGGIYVVPTYERHMINAKYAEYVETAISDKKWVIVKTLQIKEKQENYWIISKDFDIANLDCSRVNCDSILQSYVEGPFDKNRFKEKKTELGIDLDF